MPRVTTFQGQGGQGLNVDPVGGEDWPFQKN